MLKSDRCFIGYFFIFYFWMIKRFVHPMPRSLSCTSQTREMEWRQEDFCLYTAQLKMVDWGYIRWNDIDISVRCSLCLSIFLPIRLLAFGLLLQKLSLLRKKKNYRKEDPYSLGLSFLSVVISLLSFIVVGITSSFPFFLL